MLRIVLLTTSTFIIASALSQLNFLMTWYVSSILHKLSNDDNLDAAKSL